MAHHVEPGRARAPDSGRRAGAADRPVGQRWFGSDDLSEHRPCPPNGFFTVAGHTGAGDWTSLAALAAEPRPKVAATRQALAASAAVAPTRIAWRVAASVDFLGLAARVLSPALLAAATQGRLPVLDAATTWCAPAAAPGMPMQLAWQPRGFAAAGAAALVQHVVEPVLTAVLHAYADAFAVAPQVLWGNVSSALVGAAEALGQAGVSVTDVLRIPPLAGTALALPPGFRRASCCLYYRLPGAGICADCVLSRAPRRRRAESG